MKNRMTKILMFVLLLVVVPIALYAIDAPHNIDPTPDPITGKTGNVLYTCDKCHNTHGALGTTGFNNACTTCHSPSDPYGKTKPFTQVDAATPYSAGFGQYSGGVNPGKLKQTSHNWAGSDVNPQAGSLAPTNGAMTNFSIKNKLLCVRCHAVHGPYSSATNDSKFLRVQNGNDEMCRDCHRPRDVSDQLLGSHPVNIDYASVVAANPTVYNATPKNINPANPTSNLNLKSGKLQCTTCHGVHYTDSNSGTTHNSTNFNNLSASARGNLMRTDVWAKDAAYGTNLCNSCHNKPAHVAGSGIQCADCHTGHVEYVSPADQLIDGPNPNRYMLRRYVNYSAGVKISGYRRKVLYQYTSLNSAFYRDGKGTGVCEACHKPTPGANTSHDATGPQSRATCATASCHGTQPGHSLPAPGCGTSTCHGAPPIHNAAGGVANGYGYDTVSGQNYALSGANVFKNESTAGHATHAAGRSSREYSFACDQCHRANKTQITSVHAHDGGGNVAASFQWVFKNNTGMISKTTGSALPAPNPTYTGGATVGTCSTIYCHSNGVQRAGATVKYKSVTWASSRFTIVTTAARCVACHNGVITGFNNMSTGSHFRHVSNAGTASGKGYGCVVCHNATVADNSTLKSLTTHVNGAIDLAYGTTPATGQNTAFTGTNASCVTYCHSDGKGQYAPATVTWTTRSSGACGTCHKTFAPSAFGLLSSNAHFEHFSTSYGPKLNSTANTQCAYCHAYTSELGPTHVDGTVSVTVSACNNCHAQSTPPWSGGSVSCQSCHSGRGNGVNDSFVNRSWSKFDGTGVQAPFKSYTTFTNDGHGKFANSNSCLSCHDRKNKNHIDGIIGSADKRLLSGADDNTHCASCHNNALIVTTASRQNMKTHDANSTEYGTGTVTGTCVMCHDPHGSNNISGIRNVINGQTIVFTNNSTGYYSTVKVANKNYFGLCQVCHTKTTAFRNTTTSVAQNWNNHNVLAPSTVTKRCTSCHNHNPASFTVAFKPTGGSGCNGCHGYPPVPAGYPVAAGNYADGKPATGNVNAGTYHVTNAHLDPTITAANGPTPCLPCHPDVSQGSGLLTHKQGGTTVITANVNVFDPADTSYRFDGSRSKRYYANRTCGNVSCHFRPSPAWYQDRDLR